MANSKTKKACEETCVPVISTKSPVFIKTFTGSPQALAKLIEDFMVNKELVKVDMSAPNVSGAYLVIVSYKLVA